jgi:class 3 adenylate cyclase
MSPSAEAASAEAERLLKLGEPLLAYNVVQEGLRAWPAHPRLRQLQGLALSRSGDLEQANVLLADLVSEGLGDPETLGMLARTHKELALLADDAFSRKSHLIAAYALYHEAYEDSRARGAAADAYYTGINAATVAVLRGDLAAARRIAADVEAICARAAAGEPPDYWAEATLGEAALILGAPDRAAVHYGNAAALAAGHHGNLSSTRRQAELLASNLPVEAPWIPDLLRIPPVLIYSGHMIDHADRATPRFPPALEALARDAIRARVSALRPLASYGSAACGADLLFLEAVQAVGGETHVVLPFPPAEFREVSVDFAGADWGARFDRALAAASSVTVTSDHRARDSTATFDYANLVFTGMGRLRAQLLRTDLHAVALLDSGAAGAVGGTASTVSAWQHHHLALERIDLRSLREQQLGARTDPPAQSQAQAQATVTVPVAESPRAGAAARHEIRAMLFADAVGFSQLSEDQIPGFVSGFLGTVASLNARTRHRPEHVETSGDGLYMVFRDTVHAARYALELSSLVERIDRAAAGLPRNFNLRIALHCGPVYCGWNPVTDAPLYTGPHASRAARLEPITPPGQVYASSAFAAVASAHGADDLAMRYIGRIPLAKNYGALSVYHVRPTRTTDSSSTASEAANSV